MAEQQQDRNPAKEEMPSTYKSLPVQSDDGMPSSKLKLDILNHTITDRKDDGSVAPLEESLRQGGKQPANPGVSRMTSPPRRRRRRRSVSSNSSPASQRARIHQSPPTPTPEPQQVTCMFETVQCVYEAVLSAPPPTLPNDGDASPWNGSVPEISSSEQLTLLQRQRETQTSRADLVVARGNERALDERVVHERVLVERFRTDEELPQSMRDQCSRLSAARASRVCATKAYKDVKEVAIKEFLYETCDGFVWEPMAGWRGARENFLPERVGPTSAFATPYDGFRAFWGDDVLTHIVEETNAHARSIQRPRFRHEWYDTNVDEILILFAFWMLLGIVRMPTIKSCFATATMFRTQGFRTLFDQQRYWNLVRVFHLARGSVDPNDPSNVLYQMGPVLDHLNAKFKEHYVVDREICIGESLTPWKGPVKFMEHIKSKAARFGLKTYQLCESKTGYCYAFFVYVGRRSTSDSTLPTSASFVMRLVEPLLNLGHVLYLDSWLNSPQLARYLKRRGTDCVGTLRANRMDVPQVIQKAALSEGQFVARQAGEVAVFALQDKKRVHLISTYHGTEQDAKKTRPGRPAQTKLKLIDDYNRGMGGVDRLHQTLEPYLVERKKCKPWPKTLFKRLLNVSIQNARTLVEQTANEKVDSLCFRMSLVEAIKARHLSHVPRVSEESVRTRPAPEGKEGRLVARHFVERRPILTSEEPGTCSSRGPRGRSKCAWCRMAGRTSVSSYWCPDCKVTLCFERGCFKEYHTLERPRSCEETV